MNLEGLRAIVNKEEIVPTRQARDFLAGSQEIDDLYKHHVRTYIPLQSGSDEASGVTAFASRFIKQVKEAKAPRGYITADFGYGKTSAGLFVWQRAQDARLVAVPPFKVNRLEDLLDATAGWVAYILGKTVPTLVEKAVEIYRLFHNRELDSIAKRYGVTLDQAERMYSDRALQLNITPQDIVRFFEEMTNLVLEAGMEGLVVIPDELQQYLDPEIKSGRIDPLVPLFDIITELMNQQGKLAFGFLMIITSKELGVINDQRGDLIDRLRGNTLDLRTIYDRDFPARLWIRFAETFDYVEISEQLVDNLTLDSLGQIASRPDLSNGPRTVINAFRRIARHALDSDGNIRPYSPIDLVDDFLANQIAFDARKLLQEATGKALATSFIRGNHHLEQAVKLLAAFPVDGATRDAQRHFGLLEGCNELRASGSPEIVVEIGDRHRPALMLRALDAAQENTDELSLILREFVRNYEVQAANQMQRAVNSFMVLLSLIFKAEQWTTESFELRNFARNAEAVFVGTFSEMAKRFPERTVLIRVIGDDEVISTTNLQGECQIVFALGRHLDLPKHERLRFLGNLQTDVAEFTATFSLNLMLPCFDNLNRAIQDQLRRVVDVEDVSVMMALALHAYLMDAAERDSVSKPLKEMIKRSMSVRLLEGALEVLLNPAIGSAYSVNGGLVVEKTVNELIYARYGEQYETLITYKQWRDNLRSYINVLRQLSSFSQKQGVAMVEGTKEEIARKFNTTAATFDNYQARFPDLLKIAGGSFPGRKETRKSGVLLTRHSLEEVILSSLEGAPTITTRDRKTVRALKIDEVYGGATDMGYRPDEIKFIVEIMQARDLVDISGGWLYEKPRPSVSIRAVAEQVEGFKRNARLLHEAVKQADTEHLAKRAEKYAQQLKELDKQHKEAELILLDEQVQSDLRLLQAVVERTVSQLREQTTKLRLADLPREWSEVLIPMISAGSFTTTLNKVRLHFEQLMRKWNAEAAPYRERIEEMIGESANVDLGSLQRFTGRVNQLTQQHLDLNEQRRLIEVSVQQLELWKAMANDLYELLEHIQRLGEPAKEMLEQWHNTEKSITSAFDKNAFETFQAAERFRQPLSQLRQQVDRFASQAERKFTQEQEQFRALLIQKTHVKPENLWRKIVYSANDPDGVYSNLYQAVEGQMGDLLDAIAVEIENADNACIALQTLQYDSNPDSHTNQLSSKLESVKVDISKINEQYTTLAKKAVPPTNQDLKPFGVWIDLAGQLQQKIYALQKSIQKLRESTKEPELSPEEQRLLEFIANNESIVDLIRIRQALNELGNDTFWSVVRSAWEKQRIQIKLSTLQ